MKLMIPTKVVDYSGNLPLANPILCREFSLCPLSRGADGAYFVGDGTSQLVSHQPFIVGVTKILLVCSKPKMIRSAAELYVAFMANVKAIWNWTVGEEPSVAIGCPRDSVANQRPIAIAIDGSCPQPASVSRFVYGIPEVFRDAKFSGTEKIPMAFLRAEVILSLVNLVRKLLCFGSARVTFNEHLKTFLLGVTGVAGYSQWLPLQKRLHIIIP